jgi:hypothetical protein
MSSRSKMPFLYMASDGRYVDGTPCALRTLAVYSKLVVVDLDTLWSEYSRALLWHSDAWIVLCRRFCVFDNWLLDAHNMNTDKSETTRLQAVHKCGEITDTHNARDYTFRACNSFMRHRQACTLLTCLLDLFMSFISGQVSGHSRKCRTQLTTLFVHTSNAICPDCPESIDMLTWV